MAYVLALDQGTTCSRAIVFDATGRVRGLAQAEFPQHFPAPDRVEHDPQDILRTQFDCAREALANAGVAAREVAAIGIGNQRETTVLWERASGRALAPAIVWQDRRTAAECARLRAEGWADDVRARTGLELDPYFSATKLAWLLDHVPGARERAERGELAFGTIDSWLVWHLTGGRLHLTDPRNASRTMLFNLHTLAWDPVLLERLRIPAALLPRVVASSGVCGETDPKLFGAAIPSAGIGGDQQAATFGQASDAEIERQADLAAGRQAVLRRLAPLAEPRQALIGLCVGVILMVGVVWLAGQRVIGDVAPGAPELWPSARYNQDASFLARNYSSNLDLFVVVVETPPEACVDHTIMRHIERFGASRCGRYRA